MSKLRNSAINNLQKRERENVGQNPVKRVVKVFGQNVFTTSTARNFLDPKAYKSLAQSIEQNQKIERSMSSAIAAGLKAWAISKGVTHFTHWFQPLSGMTAEKHDSFFTLKPDGTAIEEFDGDALVQQEPDASSFPSGGLRATFEARGYTAWDPSSQAFIIDISGAKTLCIPTIFVSYTGETLDYKGPLLKSIEALNKSATAVCQYFDKNVKNVFGTLGWEQEYFLIDEGLANARPDITLMESTVFGHITAKGQQLEDHYFGSIPDRAYLFMKDLEQEAYKLGIPLTTRHNEVAPSQYEFAPVFEKINLAVDHNVLFMDIMSKVAKRHKLKVLLHEKPFAGINGSGKHCNFSMATNTGVNLLSPGKTPRNNLMFLAFFVNTIKAVYDYAPLLRSSIASVSNDFRLGANEAPPAIISVFIGSYLEKVIREIEDRVDDKFDEQDEVLLKMDIHKSIPELMLDNTDRNRTSPFAFTGNKFEFRAVGSSANCASPLTVLCSILAKSLQDFKKEVDEIIKKEGEKKEIAIMHVIKKYIKHSKDILFAGDGYSKEWEEEAEKRGLENIKTTVYALDALVSDKSIDLFQELGIMKKQEVYARHEIELEKYLKKVQIHGRVLGDLSINHVIPAAIKYQNSIIENIKGMKDLGLASSNYQVQEKMLNEISSHIAQVYTLVDEMIEERKKANVMEDNRDKAIAYGDNVKPYFDRIRYHVDKLETMVEDGLWDLPKYRELLFLR